MERDRKRSKNELLKDYHMLDKMSKDLIEHQKAIRAIGMKIAKNVKSDIRYCLVDNLEDVIDHMDRAQKELDRAKRELGLI